MDKKVYIIGAGASAAAKLPIQNNILHSIFTTKEPQLSADFMSSNNFTIKFNEKYKYFDYCRRILSLFIIDNFADSHVSNCFRYLFLHEDGESPETFKNRILQSNEPKIIASWDNIYECLKNIDICLEDVFTLIDKAIILKDCFQTYSAKDLINVSHSLSKCILYVISYCVNCSCDNTTIHKMANILVNKRFSSGQKSDPFSIITLNWDTLLDSCIFSECQKYNQSHKEAKAYIDYCFYNYDLSKSIPSFIIKAMGHYNIKLLKLHGSTNWLRCSNCGRIHTNFERDITIECLDNEKEIPCEYCEVQKRAYENKHFLLTPTLIKNLDNLQIKNIWHNAYLDIAEAKKIIFIGYSFPMADFELRYLLKKAINPNTEITVILHKYDNPLLYKKSIKRNISSSRKKSFMQRIDVPYNRYKAFFPNHPIEFIYNGVENCLDRL